MLMDNSLYKKSKISVLKFLQANLFFFRIPTPENSGKLIKRQKRLESNTLIVANKINDSTNKYTRSVLIISFVY